MVRLDNKMSSTISRFRAIQPDVTFIGSERQRYLRSADAGDRFPVNDVFADLCPRSMPGSLNELAGEFFSNVLSMQTGVFRSPLMAYAYERGWRQNFNAAGFLGIEK